MLGNGIEMSLIFGRTLGPLVLGWASNHFVFLGAQLVHGEKKVSLYPCSQASLSYNLSFRSLCFFFYF